VAHGRHSETLRSGSSPSEGGRNRYGTSFDLEVAVRNQEGSNVSHPLICSVKMTHVEWSKERDDIGSLDRQRE
jgi:hypothetical protein